jgi:ATP-binding protein involved in chromosome partitioning
MHLPLLGEIPLDPLVREAGDQGRPTTITHPQSAAGLAFRAIADAILEAVEVAPAGARP